MASRIVRSKASIEDFEGIWQFIGRDSERQADRWIRLLDERIAYLAEHNELGRPRPELADNLRSSPFKDYVIFYRPLPDGLAVARVLHSSRDIQHDHFEP